MDLKNKKKHHVKIVRTTERDKIYALLDQVEIDEENDLENLLNNSDNEFVLKN